MKKLLLAIPILILLVAGYVAFTSPQNESYSLSSTGFVTYKLNTPRYTTEPLPNGDMKIVFKSRGADIVGIYAPPVTIPPSAPAFVVLPGGNVKKEAEHLGIAKDLRELGFATLTLDQRGIGETGGPFPPMEDEILAFANQNEPVNHKMVADAIEAAKVLSTMSGINREKIYIAGVSMGGRVAIIAAAQDPDIKGVLAVSAGGFSLPAGLDEEQRAFFTSINPDFYVGSISPRPLIMIHAENDPVVSYQLGQKLFNYAREPKTFFTGGEGHGYYSNFHKHFLEQALPGWR